MRDGSQSDPLQQKQTDKYRGYDPRLQAVAYSFALKNGDRGHGPLLQLFVPGEVRGCTPLLCQ